jgi:hypothetical protein
MVVHPELLDPLFDHFIEAGILVPVLIDCPQMLYRTSACALGKAVTGRNNWRWGPAGLAKSHDT